MKKIETLVAEKIALGMTINQAESSVCQQIILNKISKSPLADNVLLKGGVVMFNLTKNIRRSTEDIDFDLIRYDISDTSVREFIRILNKNDSSYRISVSSIEELNQDDYKGKRVYTTIQDSSRSIGFKLDIGVHTLLAIEQENLCFSFADDVFLKVNPPEQIFAEKAYSLAKHGPLTTRFKDVFDMYYLIINKTINRAMVKKCFELLSIKGLYGIKSLEDICEKLNDTLEDKQFLKLLKSTKDRWLDDDISLIAKTILDFVYSI